MTIRTDKPDLLVPDRSIVSIEQAKQELQQKAERRGVGSDYDYMTRKEMLIVVGKVGDGIAEAAVAMGQKVFDQIADETSELLSEMHGRIRAEVLADLYARSWRGRAHAVWTRVRDYFTAVAAYSSAPYPPLRIVDATEALDPNVAAAEAEQRAIMRGLAEP